MCLSTFVHVGEISKMTQNVITIESLSKDVGTHSIFEDINLNVTKGEIVALLGENGAGKTTLLETMLGFSSPSKGVVSLFGESSIGELSNGNKRRIAYVPQTDELVSGMTVSAYLQSISVFYPAWNRTLQDNLIREWKVPLNTVISKLSVGQKQMVSIISALAYEPELIILDEPVSSLDPISRRKFLESLVEMHLSNQATVIFSTHIVSDVERVASRVWLMQKGRLKLDRPLDSVKEQYGHSLENIFLEVQSNGK